MVRTRLEQLEEEIKETMKEITKLQQKLHMKEQLHFHQLFEKNELIKIHKEIEENTKKQCTKKRY